MKIHLLKVLQRAAAVSAVAACALLSPARGHALSLDTYADSSRLATGHWVKISVPTSGIYAIKPATLRRWGFTSPADVRVYGYGAERIGDQLNNANYIDDLPLASQQVETDGTVVFFAQGPESWETSVSGRYHGTYNIFTNDAYYFLAQTGDSISLNPAQLAQSTQDVTFATTFNERLHHEQDIATVGEAGALLVGEDFRFTPTRTFRFDLAGRAEDTPVWFECSFVTKTLGQSSNVYFSVDGKQLESLSTDIVPATSSAQYYHGTENVMRRTLNDYSGNSLSLGVTHRSSTPVYGAWLNYLSVNYTRRLELSSQAPLLFYTADRSLQLTASADGLNIWDVTDHRNARPVYADTESQSGKASWTALYGSQRRYVAWNKSTSLPEPKLVGKVSTQNLHAHRDINMIIVCPRAWSAQAERIAQLHRDEGLTVQIVEPEQIYNEFASGAADVSALRKYFKMVYDRGQQSDVPLQYVLLMARATYDNRHNTPDMAKAAPTIPSWYGGTMRENLNDNDGFGTDDFVAMLRDNQGGTKGSDEISIAVGRIPVTSLSEATNYVDKMLAYSASASKSLTGWENQIMLLADDEDQAEHLDRCEDMADRLAENPSQQFMINKVYMDAYKKQNGNYPEARELMFRHLNEGVVWWTFIGHANNHSMTHDGQLTYNDINGMYLKRTPVLYAATCDFLRWDSNTLSGGEILMHERFGGTISTISATRPVYIYENGLFTNAMGRQLGQRDNQGRYLTPGEVYRRAKNDIRNTDGKQVSSPNRLRYVFMGDPALRLPTPENIVRLDSIAGVPVANMNSDTAEPPCIAARQSAIFTGTVVAPDGQHISDFNGTVTATIYDAERSVTTNGNGNGAVRTYNEQGGKLFAGSAPVVNGRFALTVNLPSEIDDNYRPATINLVAQETGKSNPGAAVGISHDFYVFGIDETALPDTIPPVIEEIYLNHASFRSGDMVNASPALIARVSDDRAINLSTSGVGHSLTLIVDGAARFTNLSQYYTPNMDGSAGGTINFPMDQMEPGVHNLQLRVWDTSNNLTSTELEFQVGKDVAPKIYDIYTDANPATTQANFYLSHDRPDQLLKVTVTVYNMLGHPLWSSSVTGVSDMFESTPVSWNLCDAAGRRVQRGIYLYRATISEPDGLNYDTGSRRIAVTD